jgi:hypothetical protein
VRSQFNGRKRTSVALGTLLALAVAGGAFAYWTIGGSGTGTATAGNVDPVTVNQTSTVSDLYPGDSQALAGDFDNTNDGPVWVSSVSAAVTGVTSGSEAGKDPCTTGDFTITGTAPVGAQIPVGAGVGGWSGLTLSMVNAATNQDNCKNATVTITYTANP